MREVYTCPSCRRQYTVEYEGDYLCECGLAFHYPETRPFPSSNMAVAAMPHAHDSASRSMRKSTRFHRAQTRSGKIRKSRIDCPLARASLICGILGVIFFGLLSVPAFILGMTASCMIARSNRYKGAGLAIAGLILGIFGCVIWALCYVLLI